MYYGGGWNLDLEESYLLKYNEYEAEIFTKCIAKVSIRLVKLSSSKPSPILHHSKISRITKFSLLGFPLAAIAAVF